MALAWFICGYKVEAGLGGLMNSRYCAMNDFTPQINVDGGTWSESEILGGYAVVKVRANAATLTIIGATTGYYRIQNHWLLTDTLTDLNTTQRNAITTRILAMGYTQAELNAIMGSTLALWRQKTLATLLRFMADDAQQQIVLDGALVACKPIDWVNTEVN